MTYTFGKSLNGTLKKVEDQSYDFPAGEKGVLVNATYESNDSLPIGARPDEPEVCQKYIAELKKQGATVTYLRAHVQTAFKSVAGMGHIPIPYIQLVVERCEFISDGFPIVAVIYLILAILVLGVIVTVAFAILFPGIFYQLFGVTPGQAAAYNLAQFTNYIVLAVAVILGIGIIYFIYSYRDKLKLGISNLSLSSLNPFKKKGSNRI